MESPGNAQAREGADNLLLNCARIVPGTRVLFVNERSPGVDADLVAFLEVRAGELGAQVSSIWPGRAASPEAIPGEVMDAIDAADCAIFNHQLGPMLRLRPPKGGGAKVLNYATRWALLASPFARVPYGLWTQAMRLLGPRLGTAHGWHIRCALGTDLQGSFAPATGGAHASPFTLDTFPMDTHSPRVAENVNGRIALRWLATSAMHDLGTEGVALDSPVLARVADGRIVGFEGEGAACRRAEAFLEQVGAQFGKDPFYVNSWHAGVNPQTQVAFTPAQSLEQWMLLGHASPRMLHFHIVGRPLPGEISAAVIDPTVTIDGETWWEDGQLRILREPAFQELAARYPGHAPFALQADIGL